MAYSMTPSRPARPAYNRGGALEDYKQALSDRLTRSQAAPQASSASQPAPQAQTVAPPAAGSLGVPQAPQAPPQAPPQAAPTGVGTIAGQGGVSGQIPGAAPTGVGSVAAQGGVGGVFREARERANANAPQTIDDMIRTLPHELQQKVMDYNTSLYSGGDYEGRHEQNQMLVAQYVLEMIRRNGRGEVDFSGGSAIGDQFKYANERLTQDMAAQGFVGQGAMMGAQQNLAGDQAATMGQFYRDKLRERELEDMRSDERFQEHTWDWQGKGLEKNWAEQADSGFWGDIAGTLGGVAGAGAGLLLSGGNPMGATVGYGVGSGLGNAAGGNSNKQMPMPAGMGNKGNSVPDGISPEDWALISEQINGYGSGMLGAGSSQDDPWYGPGY